MHECGGVQPPISRRPSPPPALPAVLRVHGERAPVGRRVRSLTGAKVSCMVSRGPHQAARCRAEWMLVIAGGRGGVASAGTNPPAPRARTAVRPWPYVPGRATGRAGDGRRHGAHPGTADRRGPPQCSKAGPAQRVVGGEGTAGGRHEWSRDASAPDGRRQAPFLAGVGRCGAAWLVPAAATSAAPLFSLPWRPFAPCRAPTGWRAARGRPCSCGRTRGGGGE